MDDRYYEILRSTSQEDLYQAINDPEAELYDILWDLFETVVIEPAETFDSDFRNHNQFRYSIDDGAVLEFFPAVSYFKNRNEPDPYNDDVEAAGIHLRLAIQPHMSCLFSVGFQLWGRTERLAFKQLWQRNRRILAHILHRAKPMVITSVPFGIVDHASTLDEMLDNYFSVSDPENFLGLQYSFAQFDDTVSAENFMVYMALFYHCTKDFCQRKRVRLDYWMSRVKRFYSGRLPDLPPPIPCVEVTVRSDI